MDTYFPADLARREAEICGDAYSLILGARSWLYRADSVGSMMARHALSQAAADIERAAMLLPDDLAKEAIALAARCDAANETAGFPWTGGLEQEATALLEKIEGAP